MRCRFKHKIFQNEENGYTIAIFTTQDPSVPLSARDKYLASRNIIGFSAIGFGLPLTDEIELEMEGRWESGDHGTQYQVESFMEVVPRTKEGILGYLSSGAVKGIGSKTADMIFRKFGLQTLEIMENNPQELLKIRGISEKKLDAIVESYGKNQVFRELMTFLAPFKVTPKKVNMILKKFENESVDIIRHRPYMLSAVKGFGFLTVDAIGRQCCCALNDPMRISGCIGHIMSQAMKEGHLFKQRQEVMKEALEMLNRDLQVMAVSEQDVSQVLYRLVLQKSIVVEEERIYSIRQYEEETQTASMIARRLLEKPVPLSIEPELEKAQKTLGITLSETQKQAVRMVFAHPISIITGGPGTGKTTVLKVILYIHQALCRTEVQLMAPTGRAARRMVESTGCENASTMHLALGLLGDDTDFEPDFEYLSAGFLNVDEVSMVDMHLAYEFFRRVSRHARVLLVGDKNQLPSVGAGDVLRQMIACGLIPVTVLDLVYRQGALSSIPYNAKLMQENKTNLSFGEDFQFMNNLLILLILLVIHFFALTYLTVEIAEVLPLDKYRENYPYDMVWMAKEEDEAFAEKLVRKYDGNMTELPMIRVTTYYGAQHIGVSASEYEKLTGKDVNLSEREILVGIEDSEYQKEKKITDEDYLNTYSFLFTGKYQEDMAEISHTDPQYLYDIKDIFTQNVIGQYSTDQWHENIIVFSDTYFQKQWEAMRGDDQEATVLRLFTFSGKRKENAWKELSEYQKECGVKNDSDTRMESYLYATEEYLIWQKMRLLFSLSSKLFLMMALFISAFFEWD